MSAATPSADVHLSCRAVWKIFGLSGPSRISAENARAAVERSSHGIIVALRDVNLDVKRGEIFVIMGLSGSGKSTLVRCMSRLAEPTAGSVMFDGIDLLAADERKLIDIRRHKMGMVFQHFALLPHLTVLDNVAFPLKIQGVRRQERHARAREVIELVGLKGRENHYPRELSGGQQQRVGIARSLAVKPEIWFLDEPFSALDPLIRREMQEELMRLQRLLHKTIVFITHDFDEAIRIADRLAIMKDGIVIQLGTPEQIISNPATDYVAAFTRDAPKGKVLSAASIMQQLNGSEQSYGGQVPAATKVAALATQVMSSIRPWAVIDDDGKIIGTVAASDIAAVLAGSGQESKA